MGCYNSRCVASGLPIFYGDPIVGVPIIRHISRRDDKYIGSGTVYPTAICSPICLPIFGEYNDYGNMEKFEVHWFHNVLLQLVNDGLIASMNAAGFAPYKPRVSFVNKDRLSGMDTLNAVGTNYSAAINGMILGLPRLPPTNPIIPDLESLLDVMIAGGGLTIDNQGIGVGLIRRDVWDGFVQLSHTATHWRLNGPVLENLASDFDLYKKFIINSQRFIPGFGRHVIESTNIQEGNIFSDHMSCDVFAHNLLNETHNWLQDNHKTLSDEQWTIFKIAACDFIRFSLVFSLAGKWWHPQPVAGQDREVDWEWKIHRLQGQILEKIQQELDLERIAEEESEEDENA